MREPEILAPEGATTIATVRDLVRRLAQMFPRAREEILEWADAYQRTLGHLGPADLAATFHRVVDAWDKPGYPKPAAFIAKVARAAGAAERHALYVEPPRPFPISDQEFAEWKRQNGELFLARLPWWHRMRRWMGDENAADALKRANDDDEAWRIYDQWKHGEPIDPKREPPFDLAAVAAAREQMDEALAAVARKGAVLRGDAPAGAPSQTSARASAHLRAAADQHRAAFMGAETQRAGQPEGQPARDEVLI